MRELKDVENEIKVLQEELSNVHGTETEVYARIVGYYRAVKNWNKGKRDEYNSRKNFSVENLSKSPIQNEKETISPEITTKTINQEDKKITSSNHFELYIRQTCPNCPPVKEFMSKINLEGRTIDVDTEHGLSEAASKGVFAAPTVILYNKDVEVARAHCVEELSVIFETVSIA